MSDVRVRLQAAGFRLEYSGSQSFFERVVVPLWSGPLAALPPTAPVPPPAPVVFGTEVPVVEPGEGPGAVAPEPPPVVPVPERRDRTADSGYRPPPQDFGPFVQKLGSEAAEPDRQVVAFAFFLWNYQKKNVIKADELAGCFRAIGLPVPPDLRELAESLANKHRFFAPSPEPNSWTLTQKGANYVKTRLLGATS